ncbi:MAG: GvpL/GvpF family gas vesicle protein [Methanothrix sp.]|nr:GvpL/GvpF family gas vesicle protein [Methanothrix sp.]
MVRRIRKAEKDVPDLLGRYVYCVIPSPITERKSFGNLGFDGSEVYTMDYRDLSPVVSDVPYRDYAVNEEEVEIHRNVVEKVMQEYSIIPVAFGMAFKSKKLLQIAMSAGYQAMQKARPIIDGRVELGIKVFIPKVKESMDSTQREECSADFLNNLLTVSSDSKRLKLFSDRLILNSTFLVERSAMDGFSAEVGRLKEKYPDMKVQYSGPWPAYNFVDIHILGGKRRGFR